jgi:WD40 repeat protein
MKLRHTLSLVTFVTFLVMLRMPVSLFAQEYEPSVENIDWSADGKYLAVGLGFQTIEILDASTQQVLRTLKTDTPISDLAWSPEPASNRLAISGVGILWIIDPHTGDNVVNLNIDPTLDCWVRFVEWSPDGTKLATGQIDRCPVGSMARLTAIIWDAASGEPLLTLGKPEQSYTVGSLAWSPDGTHLAVTEPELSQVGILDAITGEKIASIETNIVSSNIVWSPDGSRIASGSEVWDSKTLTQLAQLGFNYEVEWSPDGRYISVAMSVDDLLIYDAETYEIVYRFPRMWIRSRVQGLSWSPDSRRLAFGRDTELEILELSDPPVATLLTANR